MSIVLYAQKGMYFRNFVPTPVLQRPTKNVTLSGG
jgi:hypothetical protein